jgi:hypothetical protein
MAKILEDALYHALMPVIERLDAIEDRLIEEKLDPQPNPQIEQMKEQLNDQQQDFNNLVATLVTLSEGLNLLMKKLDTQQALLDKRMERQDRELILMSEEIASTAEMLKEVAQDFDRIINSEES